MNRLLLVATLVVLSDSRAFSSDSDFFETRIRPILVESCYDCHNSTKSAEGSLAVDFRDGLRRGGKGGELIVPGEPAKSRLIAILKHDVPGLEMPEDSGKLDENVIADFEKWIADGAFDPRENPPKHEEIEQAISWESTLAKRKLWWSFQPIRMPELPVGEGHPIDKFIDAKLQDVGLVRSSPAEEPILIRRLFFQLIGLPPTPEELEHWLSRYRSSSTKHDLVTEELVEHLLASKQFGVRWARHWMDWIRYAESHGSEGDPVIKNAWMYRDYLIRALNDDVTYDQLVREHLAGDLIASPRINSELGLNESLLGAIQLRMVFHGFSPTDALDEKVRFVDDQVNAISKAFLGITVSCARCHDHKFDAISQVDYFAMFGMFAACRPGSSIADAPASLNKNVQSLTELKHKIRERIAANWIESMPALARRLEEKLAIDVPEDSLLATIKNFSLWDELLRNHKIDSQSIVQAWDLRGEADLATWHARGVTQNAAASGEFAVSLSGPQAIHGVYPAGIYSHLLSTKHPLRLSSPDIVLDGKYDYWIRAIGSDDSATRYVTQDYPRTGTVFKSEKLSGVWKWRKMNLDYWEGDSVHIEIATGPDIPLLSTDNPRSWFGASEVLVVKHDTPLPDDTARFISALIDPNAAKPTTTSEAQTLALNAIDRAVRDWKKGACTDSQSLLVDECIRIGLLDNELDSLPLLKPLVERYRKLESEISIPRRVPGLDDVPERTQPLYVRGNHKQPADLVPRRFLEAIDGELYPPNESGRQQFADDLLRDDNPLSRRVIVNRLWHHLFGRGLVATPDNFGKLGSLPTHPELLDWLAVRFVEDGWSIKKMIRLIVTSKTWQQSSQPSPESRQIDPDNHYLARSNVRRLEAESIRDSMLRVAGTLEDDVQGEPVDGGSNRRSVFVQVHRNSLDPMLRVFDFPEPVSAVGSRDVTNVPAQSLLMMNSPQVAAIASNLAKILLEETDELSVKDKVNRLYLRVLSREANELEMVQVQNFIASTGDAIRERQTKFAALTNELRLAKDQLAEIIEPKREAISQAADKTSFSTIVTPMALWEFEQDASDNLGGHHGVLANDAIVREGLLVVSKGAHVNTSPLNKSITAKTLEAWVKLDTLKQQGGGVMTLQTRDGNVFDSIVFAEQKKRHWLAGSNGFVRTQPFNGTPEKDAENRVVHVAISYHADGTVIGYRDGVRYGSPYKTSPPVEFRSGDAIVSFGVRHLPNLGNRQLAGQIERAKLYDKALSDEEISDSFHEHSGLVSDAQVMSTLSEGERSSVLRLTRVIEGFEGSINQIGPMPNETVEHQVWTDVARTMFTLKEFIYVR